MRVEHGWSWDEQRYNATGNEPLKFLSDLGGVNATLYARNFYVVCRRSRTSVDRSGALYMRSCAM